MNNLIYPNWWNSTITIFNKFENKETQEISWYKHVIHNCFWYVNLNADVSSASQSNDIGNIICRIPRSDKFLNAHDWKKLKDKSSKFTLQNGDLIFRGNITDTIDEYTKGKRASDLLAEYKDTGVMKITIYSDNSDPVRNIPHYYVR